MQESLDSPGTTSKVSALNEFILALVIAACPGFLLAAVFPWAQAGLVLTDPNAPRLTFLCLLVPLAGLGSIFLFRISRASQKRQEAVDSIRWLNRNLLFLLLIPLLQFLFLRGPEKSAPLFTLSVIAISALIFSCQLYCWPAASRFKRLLTAASRSFTPRLFLGIATAAFAWKLIDVTIFILQAQHLSSYDLAIYENLIWNTARGNFLQSSLHHGGSHFSAHFDPILALLVPLHLLTPGPETLLKFQVIWVASAALPIWLLARKVLHDEWSASFCAVAYLLHPGVHGALCYEFHSLTLVAPLVVWLMYTCELQKLGWYLAVLSLLLLTREDAAFIAVGFGLMMLNSTNRWRLGLLTILVSLGYFCLIKISLFPDPGVFMQKSANAQDFSVRFAELRSETEPGLSGILATVITRPIYVLGVIFQEAKAVFALQLLLPVLFLPLLSGFGVWTLLYGFVLCFLASASEHYSLYWQYNITLTPLLFGLLPQGIANLVKHCSGSSGLKTQALVRQVSLAVFFASVLVSAKFGVWFPNDAFRVAGLSSIHFESEAVRSDLLQHHQDLLEVLKSLPADASVSGTHLTLPYISDRAGVFYYPYPADYVLQRTDAVHPSNRAWYLEQLRTKQLELVASQGAVALYRQSVSAPEP